MTSPVAAVLLRAADRLERDDRRTVAMSVRLFEVLRVPGRGDDYVAAVRVAAVRALASWVRREDVAAWANGRTLAEVCAALREAAGKAEGA